MNRSLFGTDGIRTRVGTSPLTQTDLPRIGNAIAHWALQKFGSDTHILIGHDTRRSCAYVKAALKSGLLRHPVTLHDAHVLSTPAVCTLVAQKNKFQVGIIISASHNSHEDNGIKLITKNGKLSDRDEQTISSLVELATTYEQLGKDELCIDAEHTYRTDIATYFPPLFLQGKTVVLDCAHGATYQLAPAVFEQFGATPIVLNNKPDGHNINNNCGSLHPHHVQQAIKDHNAAIGFAFDGDGDRVIAVSKNGEIKDGDDMLALLHEHPLYTTQKSIVGTVMSNYGLTAHLQEKNINLIRTAVGDKAVSQMLYKNNLLLGGEQAGHIITRDYLHSGDGIFTALRVIESLIHTGNWNMDTFTKYPQILINIPVGVKKDLSTPPYDTIIATYQEKLTNGRLLVRYSGTERLLRVMVEDRDKEHAYTIGTQLAHTLQKELNANGS